MFRFFPSRPLHIVQPNPPGAPPDSPVDVPPLFVLFAWVWHSLPVQFAATLARRALARPREQRFVILAMPRSGSTALVHALNGHARVACAGEILNRHYRVYGDVSDAPSWRRALHCAALLGAHAALVPRAGPTAVGFKALDEQVVAGSGAVRALVDSVSRGRPARVILLTRRDLRAGFVSLTRAHRTGVWYQSATGEAASAEAAPGGEAAPAEAAPGEAAPAAAADAAELREHCEWTRAAWREIEMVELAAHDDRCCVLRLYHEELCAEPARVLRRVVDFLGVPSTDADIAAMLRRAAVSRRCAGGRSAGGLPPAEHAFEYAGRKLKEGS